MSETTEQKPLTLQVNGETRIFEGVITLSDLLQRLGVEAGSGGLAVALNLHVVPKGEFADTRLNDGDRVELVQAVQGG